MSSKLDLTGICRVCLDPTGDEYPVTEAHNGITVLSMLVALTVEDEEEVYDDEFPTRICLDCLKKLRDAYEFQQVIVKSRKELVQLLKDSECVAESSLSVTTEEGEETTFLDDETISFEPCMEVPSEPETSSNVSTVQSLPSDNINRQVINNQHKIKSSKLTKFDCGLCNKVYSDMKAFKIHFRNHTGERPYLCSVCSSTFSDKGGLDKHFRRKHTEEGYKNHQCPYCPRKTSDITHLKTHIQTHTGEKPDICPHCGKGFNGRNALRMHLRIHIEEKYFKCRFCRLKFKLKKYLERHEMIHTNNKPYQCQFCDSAFIQQGDLMKHLKQHNVDTSYKCIHCNESFRLKTELRQHMVVHAQPEEVAVT